MSPEYDFGEPQFAQTGRPVARAADLCCAAHLREQKRLRSF